MLLEFRPAGQVYEQAASVSGASAKRAVKAGGYHGTDVFTKIGIDVTRVNLEDPMHLVGNNVHNAFSLVVDDGPEEFTQKRRRCEVKLERFPELDLLPIEGRYVYMMCVIMMCL